MPIYDFTCRSCGDVFECLVGIPTEASRTEAATCPACGSRDLQRMVSAFAVNSQDTRQMHLNQARKLGRKEHLEKERTEIEALRHHHHDD